VVRVGVLLVVLTSAARAETRVPDASLRAVKERVVTLELDGAEPIVGRVLDFEDGWLTIARTGTNEVVTVSRAKVSRIIATEPPVERMRAIGVQSSLLGTAVIDVDYRKLRGFASMNLLLPILTASGGNPWYAASVGGGLSLPFGTNRRWRLDVFGQVMPFRSTSFYTYVGFGAGAGFHYTSASGFTMGITFPVIGFATRVGSSPHGYDASFRYNDSLAYYYLAGIAGMPLLTFGYRFATNCPR
jgi:hypothetical protein